MLRASPTGRVQPFALAGFHVSQASDEESVGFGAPVAVARQTAAGANAGVGLAVRWGSFAPIVGAKVELRRESPQVVFMGLALPEIGGGGP